jgi:hypothetical protein
MPVLGISSFHMRKPGEAFAEEFIRLAFLSRKDIFGKSMIAG